MNSGEKILCLSLRASPNCNAATLNLPRRSIFTSIDTKDSPGSWTSSGCLFSFRHYRFPARRAATPGGNLALVPAYSDDYLLNTGFEEVLPLIRPGSGKRLKGWQATPLHDPRQVTPLLRERCEAAVVLWLQRLLPMVPPEATA